MISAFLASLSPLISSITEISLAVVFGVTICSFIWVQEIWMIQIIFKQENIDFTRRFFQRYPPKGKTRIVGFAPHIFSIMLLVILWVQIAETPTMMGWAMTLLLFLTLIRIFDPLLGCIGTWDSIPWSGILAYFTVFLFATTSALDPSKFENLSISSEYSEALVLALLTVVILNLRMAYYEYFCFQRQNQLQQQLKIVLIPLLILSVTQVIGIIQGLDLTTNLNG